MTKQCFVCVPSPFLDFSSLRKKPDLKSCSRMTWTIQQHIPAGQWMRRCSWGTWGGDYPEKTEEYDGTASKKSRRNPYPLEPLKCQEEIRAAMVTMVQANMRWMGSGHVPTINGISNIMGTGSPITGFRPILLWKYHWWSNNLGT